MMGMPSPETVSPKLERIAKLAKEAPDMAFTSLAHHIDIDWLREAYKPTCKNGATGVDGQTADEYAANLEDNLRSLLDRAKSGTYRAPPVRRVHIPKCDGTQTCPIGIPTFEDKILQRAVAMVLEAVYEQDFLDCSYGFRPGRSAHQASRPCSTKRCAWRAGGSWRSTSRSSSTPSTTPISESFFAVRANPYPVYAQMRRHQPVTQVEPGGVWAIARHHDVAFVLKNPQLFSSAGFQRAWQPAWYGDILNPLAKSIGAVDAPVHTKLRARVSGAFNSNIVQRIVPHTRRTIDELIDGLIARGETDFMSDFASRFGYGIHACIGAQLARTEVKLALQALLTRVKRFSRVPGDAGWTMSIVTRGPGALPMRFEA